MTDAQALLSSMPIIEVVSIKYQESQEEEGSVEQKTKHPQKPRKPSKAIANAPFPSRKGGSLGQCVWLPPVPGVPRSRK